MKLLFQLGIVGLATLLMQAWQQPPSNPCKVNHAGCEQKVEFVFDKGCIQSVTPMDGFQVHVQANTETGEPDFSKPIGTTGTLDYKLHRSCEKRNIFWVTK